MTASRKHDLPHFVAINRVMKLPVVSLGVNKATHIYVKVKMSNRVIGYSLESAEKTVLRVVNMSVPLVIKFEDPINRIDDIMCQSLDVIEYNVPMVTYTPEEIYFTTKTFVKAKVDPVLKRADSVKQLSMLDDALSVADKYVDKYLPDKDPGEDAANKLSTEPSSQAVKTIRHVNRFSRKLQRRLTRRTIAEVKLLKKQGYDTVQCLVYFADLMELWEVVHFTSENSVEAVPHTWVKKSKCAWPKNPKLVKRFIENHIEPNRTDFFYCPAKKLGKRSYDSLTLAQMKTAKATFTNDLSSTDDAQQYNMSKKNYSTKQQSSIITKESHTSPPKYNDEYLESKREELNCKNNIEQNKAQKPSNSCPPKKYMSNDIVTTKSKNMNNLQEQDDDSSNDDLRDKNWKSKSVFNNISSSDDDYIVVGTPSKDNEFVKKLYSTKDNWKTHTVDTPERYHNTTVTHSPATDKWTVSKTCETTYNEEPPVKRALFKDVKDPYNKPGLSADTTSSEQNKNVQFKTTDVFQTFVVNTLINLKYEINNISNVVQANHLNIDCLLANANKNPSIDISNIECNMFPIEKDEDLYNFEKKIKLDNGFRESLLAKDPKAFSEKMKAIWIHLSEDEPENQKPPENIEQLIEMLSREGARRFVHLTNFVVKNISLGPTYLGHAFTYASQEAAVLVDQIIKYAHLENAKGTVVQFINMQLAKYKKVVDDLRELILEYLSSMSSKINESKKKETKKDTKNSGTVATIKPPKGNKVNSTPSATPPANVTTEGKP